MKLACTLLLFALPAAAQGTPDPVRTLMAADLAWADSAGGIGRAMTDDALYLHEGAPVMRGRETVRAFLAAQPVQAGTLVGWQPVRAVVSDDGTMGYTLGFSAQSGPPMAGMEPALRFGRYLTVWRRGADGVWRVAAAVQGVPGTPGIPVIPAGWTPGFRADTGQSASRRAIEQADRDFSARAGEGTAAAFGAFAAPDAVTFFADVRFGPHEIAAGFAGDRARWVWAPVASGATAAGDFGFTVGEAEITPEGALRPILTKYLTVWKRQSDGSYRYLTDAGNGRPAR